MKDMIDVPEGAEPSHYVPVKHQFFLAEILGGETQVGLYPVTHDGHQTSAIVLCREDDEGNQEIGPIFVAIYPGMKLTDPYGNELVITDNATRLDS